MRKPIVDKPDKPCKHYTEKDLQEEKEEQKIMTAKHLSLIAKRVNRLVTKWNMSI